MNTRRLSPSSIFIIVIGGILLVLGALSICFIPDAIHAYEDEPEDLYSLGIFIAVTILPGLSLLYLGTRRIPDSTPKVRAFRGLAIVGATLCVIVAILGIVNYDSSDNILVLFALPAGAFVLMLKSLWKR